MSTLQREKTQENVCPVPIVMATKLVYVVNKIDFHKNGCPTIMFLRTIVKLIQIPLCHFVNDNIDLMHMTTF